MSECTREGLKTQLEKLSPIQEDSKNPEPTGSVDGIQKEVENHTPSSTDNNVNQGLGNLTVQEDIVPELVPEIENLPIVKFRRVNLAQVEKESFLTVKVKICNKEVEALLDTGARISLVKKSVVDMLGVPINKEERSKIYGIGGKEQQVITLGSIKANMGISTLMFNNTKWHVVPDNCMDHSMFIGMDFLQFNGLSVNILRKRIKYHDR